LLGEYKYIIMWAALIIFVCSILLATRLPDYNARNHCLSPYNN
jgi:hypothetical protein